MLPVLPIPASGNTQYEVTQASLLWAMAAALDLHREVALPVPLHKGLRPLYSPPHQLTLIVVFIKFSTRDFYKNISRHRYNFLQKFRLPTFVAVLADSYGFVHYVMQKAVTFLICHSLKNSFYSFQFLQSNSFSLLPVTL